jgi:hypothetical protein
MTFTNAKRQNSGTEAKLRNSSRLELFGNVSVSRYLLVTALICVHYDSAESVLNQRPKDAIVIANHSTFFNCSKSSDNSNVDSQELTWYHQPLGGVPAGVYEDGRIRDKYKDRFKIDKDLTSGVSLFNLLVERPESKDSGKYQCVEDVLEDKGASAELIILDSNLICEFDKEVNEIVGHTDCANPIAPDQLQLICSVTYTGNTPPKMEWKKVGSELLSNKTECGVRGNRMLCNATVESNRNMAGSVYICQITTAEQYKCSLKDNNFIYTLSDTSERSIIMKDEVVCSANTSVDLPCTYNWNKDNRTVKSGQTMKPNKSGKYRCEAECKIRNEICAFTAMVINVSESETIATDTRNLKMLWLLLLIILLIVIIAALTYYLRKKYDGRTGKARSQPVEEPLETLLNPQNGLEDAIRKAFDNAPFISKGLSGGEIHGPMQYEDTGIQCLCERIKRTNGEQIETQEVALTKKIRSHYEQWKALNHKNLITFYDLIVTSQDIFIMMEYAAGGSVRNALEKCAKSGVNLGMAVIKNWATQIAQGMEYLHENCIVYENLDSFRILIMESFEASNITNKTLKISQFCLIDDNFSRTHAQEKFSFTAPEVFDGTYEKPGDVWRYVLFEIYCYL